MITNKQPIAKWVKQQERAFTGWVNAHLQTPIQNLEKDIARVTPLIDLLEILENSPLDKITADHRKPRHRFDMIEGMNICLKQIKSRGYKEIPLDFASETLLEGKEKKEYLALIWRIIVNYTIQDGTSDAVQHHEHTMEKPEERLRSWCNSRLTEETQISNFTKDWSDGHVLLQLINPMLDENDRISPEDIRDMDVEELLERLLKLGEQLGVPQLLDACDLVNSPDKQAVMTYVSLLKAAIEAKINITHLRDMNQKELIVWIKSLSLQFTDSIIASIKSFQEQYGTEYDGSMLSSASLSDIMEVTGLGNEMALEFLQAISAKKDKDYGVSAPTDEAEVPQSQEIKTFTLKIEAKLTHNIKNVNKNWTIGQCKFEFLRSLGQDGKASLYADHANEQWVSPNKKEGIEFKYLGKNLDDNVTLQSIKITNGTAMPLVTTFRVNGGAYLMAMYVMSTLIVFDC